MEGNVNTQYEFINGTVIGVGIGLSRLGISGDG